MTVMAPVKFRYAGHCVVVPVRLGDVDTEFVLDSGIGVSLISAPLAASVGCERTGETFRGRRMSGQEVEVPLATLPSLELGGRRWRDLDVAIFDLAQPAAMQEVTGFLSLSPFCSDAITVDYPAEMVVVEEPGPLAMRVADGIAVPVEVEREGRSAVVHVWLDLPDGGPPIRVEVDMGSDCLILDTRLASRLGVELEDGGVRCVEGRDETGHNYTRYFAKIDGVVRTTAAPAISQRDPDVMFQRIIYDGLVGTTFLQRFQVTFDLANERLLFGRTAGQSREPDAANDRRMSQAW